MNFRQSHNRRDVAGVVIFGILLVLVCGCEVIGRPPRAGRSTRFGAVSHTLATYCNVPRKAAGRVDVNRLMTELKQLHANTYSFCIHTHATDWEDLQEILPIARINNIRIWASIVPPSESPPRTKLYAEPFKLDYERWAIEFARLSLREPNLVAWSIDDFTHNLKTYTPAYVSNMLAKAEAINPRLAFVPCCYYPAITKAFGTNYCGLIDGILFPYRHESGGANLNDPSLVADEIRAVRMNSGGEIPIFLDIYSSRHSRLGATTADYVDKALAHAEGVADGVMIYTHPDPSKFGEKFEVIQRRFGGWNWARK